MATTLVTTMAWMEHPRRLGVSGEWTVNNGAQILADIRGRLVGEPGGRFLLDLSGLRFIDSRGISNLLELKKTLAPAHVFVIVNPSSVSRKVFQLISLNRLISVEDVGTPETPDAARPGPDPRLTGTPSA